MVNILALVEGPTEEAFVDQCLAPYLAESDIFIKPVILITKKTVVGAACRGGVSTYSTIRDHVRRLLNSPYSYVTTMIDFYGLPQDFPGAGQTPYSSSYSRVRQLEGALGLDINDSRFIPYIQLHEFETLLFVSPEVTNEILHGTPNQLSTLRDILRKADDQPEVVNNAVSTSPSKV